MHTHQLTYTCMCVWHAHNSLPIWVASSNELEVLRHSSPIHPAVTHDLFDQSNRLCSVGFIKEHYSAQPGVFAFVKLCNFLCILNELDNVMVCDSSMDLYSVK